MSLPLLVRLALAGVALAAGAGLKAQLATRSPFLPPQASTSAPTAGAPLEYGGYLVTPSGERLYRLKDPARKTSDWVRLNERNPTLDVIAKEYDDGRSTLTVEYQGRTLTLAEREPKIISAGSVPQPLPAPMPTMNNAVPPAVTQSVVLNPTQADEQRRLEAVAAEVARRRALRDQATQQINQGIPPQVVVPQQQPRNFQPNNPANQGQNQQNNQRGRPPQGRQQR